MRRPISVPRLISSSSIGPVATYSRPCRLATARPCEPRPGPGIPEENDVEQLLAQLLAGDPGDVRPDVLDRRRPVHFRVNAAITVELHDGPGLLVVFAQPVPDHRLVVVAAPRSDAAIQKAPDRLLLRNIEADQPVERRAEFQHQSFEDVGLDVGAREPVEEKTVRPRVAGDRVLDELDDDLVGNQPAGGDDALGVQTQPGPARQAPCAANRRSRCRTGCIYRSGTATAFLCRHQGDQRERC
jgi:hypothetical protein